MTPQLTSIKKCKEKRTYYSYENARAARKRRNKAAGINYLRNYKCNVCGMWHLTTEKKVETEENTDER